MLKQNVFNLTMACVDTTFFSSKIIPCNLIVELYGDFCFVGRWYRIR